MAYLGLIQRGVSNLQHTLDNANKCGFSVLVVPINCIDLPFEKERSPMKDEQQVHTYSDLILTADQWSNRVICMLSNDIDCDSMNADVRRRSQEILQRDISWSEHLQNNGHTLLRLNSNHVSNLARIVTNSLKGWVLVQVPLFSAAMAQNNWRHDINDGQLCSTRDNDSWHWWNRFRRAADFNVRLKVVLELNEGQKPDAERVRRWLGEPIEAIIISTNMFVRNRNNFTVLPKEWQKIISYFIKSHVNIILSAETDDKNLKMYAECLTNLYSMHQDNHMLVNYEDMIEIPLQPLNDNLDCYTYEVFEKDPVKYKLYQDAIEAALIDRVPEDEKHTKMTVIMVLGAGRGPLVRASLNAAEKTERKVRVYIIEKNPNAIRTLNNMANELWSKRDVKIFSKDMREFAPPEKADIIVSELLGSFGDNELSPECLDCAQKILKPDGISIPCKSISYINPIMSMKLFNALRNSQRNDSYNREKISTHTNIEESGCVTLLKNFYNIDQPQPLFVFVHPNRMQRITDNSRYKVLRFAVTQDCMVNGFAGFFEAMLYKDIFLSINPATHTPGMHSWFPMFFPLTAPIDLKNGETVEVHFWRCVSKQKVWYEWCMATPVQTIVHNHGGRSYPIYCT